MQIIYLQTFSILNRLLQKIHQNYVSDRVSKKRALSKNPADNLIFQKEEYDQAGMEMQMLILLAGAIAMF